MSFSVNEFVIGSTIHGELPIKKYPQSSQQFDSYGLFRPKKAENGPNGPSKGSIRRLMYMSFSVKEFVIASTIHGEFPVKKGPQSSQQFGYCGTF